MPVTQDRLVRLREFGLSEYAARCYLALLDLGIAEARDVSSLSKVPQAKIYHVLEQLHQKGLVVILPEFPKKYAPVPFEEYLGRLFDEHSKAAESIDRQRDELAKLFRVRGDTDVADRGFFTVIRGRRNVLAKIEELITTAQREIVFLGTAGTAMRASHMLAALRGARQRNVRVRILAPMNGDTIGRLAEVAQQAELRARELGGEDQSAKVALLVCDGARAFLIHFVPDDANLSNGKDIGVVTDQEAMVAAIQAIVEPLWSQAALYEQRRSEIASGRSAEFTRLYTSPSQTEAALEAAFERDPREVLSVAARDNEDSLEAAFLARIAKAGTRLRVIRDVADVEEARREAARVTERVALRHLGGHGPGHDLVLDDHEAFLRLTGVDDAGGRHLVIHTNSLPVVAALRARLEALWGASIPIEQRQRELELFPDLQPGDIGIGRLFDVLHDAVIVADAGGDIVLWNSATGAMFGDDALRGRPLAAIVSEEARRPFEDRVTRFREKSEATSDAMEVDGVRADGTPFPMEVTLSPLKTPAGGRYVVVVARDITQRRRANEADAAAQLRIQRAYERMHEAFYALDRNWRFVYRNPTVREMQRSRTDAEIDGRVIWDAFPDLVGTRFETELKRAANEGKPVTFEEHYERLDMTYEVTAYPDEQGLSVYFRDITALRRAEASGGRRSARIEAVLEASATPLAIVGERGLLLAANGPFAELAGRELTSLAGLHHAELIAPEERKTYEERFDRVDVSSDSFVVTLAGRGPSTLVRLTLRRIDGTVETLIEATRAA